MQLRRLVFGAIAVACSASGFGATFVVDTLVDEDDGVGVNDVSLRDAINAANANAEADVITFSVTGTITLTAALPSITTDMTIDGPGSDQLIIDGNSLYRAFALLSGDVEISDLAIHHGFARGGAGGDTRDGGGGGGAAGLGGAIYSQTNAVVRNVDFDGNSAIGGDGGGYIVSGSSGGGGGGGLGAAGDNNASSSGASGGIAAPLSGMPGVGNGFAGGEGAGGSGGDYGNTGGAGGFGGGGGGSGEADGPFSQASGGAGGFGGGGGAGFAGAGSGGTFGGNGYDYDLGSGGGGGAGLGGAIFVRAGNFRIFNSSLDNNSATAGVGGASNGGGNRGDDGQGKGGAIFVNAGATVITGGLSFSGNAAEDDLGTNGDDDDVYGTLSSAPFVQSITRSDASPSDSELVTFTVTFTAAVTGVGIDDFTVSTVGVNGTSILSVTSQGSGDVYTVLVDSGSGEGTLRLDVVDNDSIVDGSMIPLGGAGLGTGNFSTGQSYAMSAVDPAVASIVRLDATPTRAATVTFEVTFDEPVSGVNSADFEILANGVNSASVTGVTSNHGGDVYIVTVNTGTGDGNVTIELADDDSIIDVRGNPLGGVGADNGGHIGTAIYTIDKTPPTVASALVTGGAQTNQTMAEIVVTFSEDVSVPAANMIGITLSGSADTGAAAVIAVSGTSFKIAFPNLSGDGVASLSLDGGAVADAAGNVNAPVEKLVSLTIDRVAPTIVSIAPEKMDIGAEKSASFVVTFSEPVSDFDASDVVVTHDGTASANVSVEAATSTSFLVTVSQLSGDGLFFVSIAKDAVADALGNLNAVGASSVMVARADVMQDDDMENTNTDDEDEIKIHTVQRGEEPNRNSNESSNLVIGQQIDLLPNCGMGLFGVLGFVPLMSFAGRIVMHRRRRNA
ncbi:MAG: Ig-like domain-containing protein [Phycisphaerae bacterium]